MLSMSLIGRLIILASTLTAVGCNDLPRDPEGTLQRVQDHKFRVGLVESPPWVVRTAGEPGGVEVELVRQFASELGPLPNGDGGRAATHGSSGTVGRSSLNNCRMSKSN